MIHRKLAKRLDLEKLTQNDFSLRGEFRVKNGCYHGWKITPDFKEEEADAYVPIDQLFPHDRFHKFYELIVQTPDSSEVVGAGHLHLSPRGDVSFGIPIEEIMMQEPAWSYLSAAVVQVFGGVVQERVYHSSSPIWFYLIRKLDGAWKPMVEGMVDLIFVGVSSRYREGDAQRQRVLYD